MDTLTSSSLDRTKRHDLNIRLQIYESEIQRYKKEKAVLDVEIQRNVAMLVKLVNREDHVKEGEEGGEEDGEGGREGGLM